MIFLFFFSWITNRKDGRPAHRGGPSIDTVTHEKAQALSVRCLKRHYVVCAITISLCFYLILKACLCLAGVSTCIKINWNDSAHDIACLFMVLFFKALDN